MSYRKRKILNFEDDHTTEVEIIEEIPSRESIKGAKIDILG